MVTNDGGSAVDTTFNGTSVGAMVKEESVCTISSLDDAATIGRRKEEW
jgi:hypothetical protein